METRIKTGVSIPKSLFEQAEAFAHRMNLSRSRLFSIALEDYLQRQRNRELLAQINAGYADGLTEEEKTYLQAASVQFSRIAERDTEGEW